jgi:ElaB/YqjD/DUF883 family membrane-anchored ribosome-binding protein
MLVTSTAAVAATDDIVLIQGIMADQERLIVEAGSFGQEQADALTEKACSKLDTDEFGHKVSRTMMAALREHAKNTGTYVEDVIDDHRLKLGFFYEKIVQIPEKCDSPSPSISDYTIIYTSCAMLMQQNGQQMLITLPPSSKGAAMELRAPGEPVITSNLNVAGQVTDAAGPINATMDLTYIELASGQNHGRHLGASTRLYDTNFEGSAGTMFSAVAGMPTVRVKNIGQAWVAANAPGLDVVRGFYRNFAREAKTPGVAKGFFGGMIDQMASITEKGMPMYSEQTISSSTTGPFKVGKSGSSTQAVTFIGVLPRAEAPPMLANLCNSTLITKGDRVQNIDAMMASADGGNDGTGPGANQQAQSEMQRAMEEARKAMEGMDPATREMMKKMGIKLPGQ